MLTPIDTPAAFGSNVFPATPVPLYVIVEATPFETSTQFVKSTVLPAAAQTLGSFTSTVASGIGLTVTFCNAEAFAQPPTVVTVNCT
ncbi:hypothetical protein D3C86_1221580 [compost metagenome]